LVIILEKTVMLSLVAILEKNIDGILSVVLKKKESQAIGSFALKI